MLLQEVESVLFQLSPALIAQERNVELQSVTELGVVRVKLSGGCCSDRIKRLIALLEIEDILKKRIPKVKIVICEQ